VEVLLVTQHCAFIPPFHQAQSAAFSAPISMNLRVRASLIHLSASSLVAALAATLVFVLWYPAPFREISGGRDLFLLVVAIDVVLGPLITFTVFNPNKPRLELVRDLGVVVLLQFAALAYGLHTVAQARPAVLALEGDRLRVVRAIDLETADFSKAPPEMRTLHWTGPLVVATRAPNAEEKLDAIQRGLAGDDLGMRPEFWQPDSERAAAFARAAKPLGPLASRWPQHTAGLDRAIAASGRAAERLGYLPVLARRTDWSALVDLKDGAVVGYVPIDGF
jgi:hypothetical protein